VGRRIAVGKRNVRKRPVCQREGDGGPKKNSRNEKGAGEGRREREPVNRAIERKESTV